MQLRENIHWTDRTSWADDGPVTTLPLATLSFEAVLRAAEVVAEHLPPTPTWSYPLLDRRAGTRVLVKHENVQPTGAFKVRGGVHLAATLTGADLRGGLVTASTGNHAQSVAYAARLRDSRATIVVPARCPDRKVAAIEALGAHVVRHGDDLAAAMAHAHLLGEVDRMRFVDPGNDPAIVLGHATAYLELFRQEPGLDTVYVPVGSGTGAAGACLVRDVLAPACRVVGVQSDAAPAAYLSWRRGALTSAPSSTSAAGLATCSGYALPQRTLRARLDDFRLVTDAQIRDAIGVLARDAHTLAEGAGAAALAALLADPAPSGRCAVVVSGGNATDEELAALAG